ncbi:MAG TPA: hypothetical protein VML55_09475 [Planctomycetaceae bacterium]|nr:hypothetical protein [Planctomycetaceae bacterium]
MSTRFAGSRHLDERRRRRLAVESDEAAPDSAAPRDEAAAAIARARARTLRHFPLRKLISSRRWKLWGVLFALSLLGAAAVAGSTLAAQPAGEWPPAAAALLSPAGPVARTFSGTLLFIAAQTAVVIWWARSRSLHDFGGRYRVWLWASATLVMWAFCHATAAHVTLGETAQWLWPLDVPSGATVYWLVPAVVWLLALLRGVDREMSECRSSRACLWLGVAALAAAAALAVGPSFELRNIERASLDMGVAVLGHLLILAALVHHARHVIYVTPEPPPGTVPLWRRLAAVLGWLARGVHIRRPRQPQTPPRTANPEELPPANRPAQTRAASDKPAARSRRAEPRRIPRATAQAAAAIEAVTHSAADAHAEPEVPARVDQTATADDAEPLGQSGSDSGPGPAVPDRGSVRLDKPPEQQQLKGLSKRERRQLRKQMKEERRQAGHVN